LVARIVAVARLAAFAPPVDAKLAVSTIRSTRVFRSSFRPAAVNRILIVPRPLLLKGPEPLATTTGFPLRFACWLVCAVAAVHSTVKMPGIGALKLSLQTPLLSRLEIVTHGLLRRSIAASAVSIELGGGGLLPALEGW
jgi:hypothetical protein